LLAVFSYGFSRSLRDFNFNWLWLILFLAIFLNFLLIFFSNIFPFIPSFYYSENAASDLGVDDVDEIVNMLRPRGIFGNPNTSMLQVNIIYLFVIVGVKAKFCKPPKGVKIFFFIVAPIILAILLGSRSELLVSCFYSIYLCWTLWGKKSLIFIGLIGFVLIVSIFILSSFLEKNTGIEKSDMLTYAISRITKTSDEFLNTEDESQGFKRPLVKFEHVKNRFLFSPLVGTGFNQVGDTYPFHESPRYLHNDWFRIIATSGIIGFMSLLWFLYKFSYRFNPILLTPFILPGLTNTFLLSIPTIMFYFFMLGILHKKYVSLT
jgi:O-antigen ligase